MVYSSSNSDVVSVNGINLYGEKVGDSNITLTTNDATYSFTLHVVEEQITINNGDLTLKMGDTFQIEATTLSNSTPRFFSSDKKCVKVSDSGYLTALDVGSSTIRLESYLATIEFNVTVVESPIIYVENNDFSLTLDDSAKINAYTKLKQETLSTKV